jgi:4-diphosphocytidyl-2-C-methyl-D-erythritol kinase
LSDRVSQTSGGITDFAPAKVNLYLHVTGRRPDGYHLLDSLAVFPAVGDTLRAMPADGLSLTVGGPFGASLSGEADNLVLRAALALAAVCQRPAGARLELEKQLPVASGIGGGSADAAAALRLLTRLWGGDGDLLALAATLGADVPVCVASQPARMRGVGEELSAAPVLPVCGLVLVNPGVAVATPEVFRARMGAFSLPADLPIGWENAAAMAVDLARLHNDLEAPAIALQPVIAEVLQVIAALPGCLLARMSGSGATCFGLFRDAPAASAAAHGLSRPGWWCWGGGLGAPQA